MDNVKGVADCGVEYDEHISLIVDMSYTSTNYKNLLPLSSVMILTTFARAKLQNGIKSELSYSKQQTRHERARTHKVIMFNLDNATKTMMSLSLQMCICCSIIQYKYVFKKKDINLGMCDTCVNIIINYLWPTTNIFIIIIYMTRVRSKFIVRKYYCN